MGRRIGRRRILGGAVLVIFVLLASASVTAVLLVRGSLAVLEGERPLSGLTDPVEVARDGLGVPDIMAESRSDAARVLGYVHAQDRFFQMDLQRRSAAGELAELMGPALLTTDREVRVHRFRARARETLSGLPDRQRLLLAAYAEGVNAGLDHLRVRPFEYLVLRKQPARWLPEDSILTLHAMFLDLSLSSATYEATCSAVQESLPEALADLLLPWGNRWNAPLQSDPGGAIVIPDSNSVDVRDWNYDEKTWDEVRAEHRETAQHDKAGSNNFAISGQRSAHGGAIVANDMHLGHRLPNIWYRVRMSWPEGSGRRALVGVTLPGTPALVVGSNGDVAWGFTNTMGDWADLIVLDFDADDPTRYRTPEGWRQLERVPELIQVAGSSPDTLWVEITEWGPVWDRDATGRRRALRWTAHDPEAVNLELLNMETAADVDEVASVAGRLGIPAQNLVCGDRSGRIAWIIAGRIPRRLGWDGRTSVSWSDGEHSWQGYVDPDENPRVIDPEEGQLWTANNPVATGKDLRLVGDGGYALGARAAQIRGGLGALGDQVAEHDLLAVALDDRALMLESWRELALETLARATSDSLRDLFVRVVAEDWAGRADPSSVSYRLVRNFAYDCIDNVYDLLTREIGTADDRFRASWLPFRHAVTWELIRERPAHLLAPWYRDWDHLVVDAVDRTIQRAVSDGRPLASYTWGAHNRVQVAHPFVFLDQRLERWFAAPSEDIPGDSFMPRVQRPRHGASERMVVSPGREKLGILHMPGGQSGHPWSPYFLAGHEAWVKGEPTPLLPGEAEHRLRLIPADQ